eukprot:1045305_1
MVDLRASWNKDDSHLEGVDKFVAMGIYVIAPEKYVYLSVFMKGACGDCPKVLGLLFVSVLDLGGIVAFIWALAVNNAYAPLMIGYGVTAIGGLFMLIWFCKDLMDLHTSTKTLFGGQQIL